MSLTSKFGTIDSKFGNIAFGNTSAGINVVTPIASNTFTISQLAVGTVVRQGIASNTFTVSQSASKVDPGSASNTFIISQLVIAFTTKIVSNLLSLSQIVSVIKSYGRNVNNSIPFTQAIRGFNGTKVLGQSLAISQVLAATKIYSRHLADVLHYTQAASEFVIHTASNVLTLTNLATYTVATWSNNFFAPTQSVALSFLHNELVVQHIVYSQDVVAGRVTLNPVSNNITYVGTVNVTKVKNLSVSNEFIPVANVFTQSLARIANGIVFTNIATVTKIINCHLHDNLNLVQRMSRAVNYTLQLYDNLVFKNYNLRKTNFAWQSQPTVVEPGVTITPPPNVIVVPNLVVTRPQSYVVLATQSRAITLWSPEFGDSEGGLSKIVQQKTTSGGLFTYVRKVNARKLKYKFEINKLKSLELRSFLINYLSSPMSLTNFKGEVFYGFISNNPFTTTSKKRGNKCDLEIYEVDVEFEGCKMYG